MTTLTRTSRTVLHTGYKTEVFNAHDDRGRAISAKITYFFTEYAPAEKAYYRVAPGRYYEVQCQQMRGGRTFGASQPFRRFLTEEARDAHVEKYLRDARQRAALKHR